MLDLNHGSGCQYQTPARAPGIGLAVNAAIDAALVARNRAQPARRYVSTSGLGRECLRQIQYDYLALPKDEGRDFEPATLRIFEAGHRGEDVVADWLKAAGFDLRTLRRDGRQFGFTALDGRFKGHIDGCRHRRGGGEVGRRGAGIGGQELAGVAPITAGRFGCRIRALPSAARRRAAT